MKEIIALQERNGNISLEQRKPFHCIPYAGTRIIFNMKNHLSKKERSYAICNFE